MSVTVDTATSRVLGTTDINLVATATSLIPTLRSRSPETDALARLPDSTIADLEKAQLFDILVPKMYGGLQCSLRNLHGRGGRTRARGRLCGVDACFALSQHMNGGYALSKTHR